ncbi:pre-toxin TG domain-containing protein [Streptococcus plurextorum]
MTKNVELNSVKWSQMKGALSNLTSGGTYSPTGYMGYSNAYIDGGFKKDIDQLIAISEKAKKVINQKDTDGVVPYSYHDDRTTAQTLQGKLEKLESYSNHVSSYLTEKIDRPFYEAMDKVGAKLEALSIRNYTTKNTVGFKRTDTLVDEYGNSTTYEVSPHTIGIADLYQVESPYKATLQKSYQAFKKSDAYKEHKLSQDEYLMAMHHTRAFSYHSLDDDRENTEMWRDLALGAGVVILTIFCPPAGLTAGVVLASADMYSAATGKDWGTGRELDTTERGLRAGFALFDLIPGVGYMNDVAKSGSKLAAKEFLQTSLKEGLEQGVKNLDSFKGLVKNVRQFGDNVLKNMGTYTHQVLDSLKNTSDEAFAFVDGAWNSTIGNHNAKVYLSSNTDEVISEAAKNFTLNGTKSADGMIESSGGTIRMNLNGVSPVDDLFRNLDVLTPEDIPTVKSGNFEEFFNRLTDEQLETIWQNKHLRRKIERQLRAPGGMHEWHLVSRAPQFKKWGVQAEQIRELRTAISDVRFVNPDGVHGGLGSTLAHNELLGIIDSSLDYETFVRRLNNWANYRLLGGVEKLPKGLQIMIK